MNKFVSILQRAIILERVSPYSRKLAIKLTELPERVEPPTPPTPAEEDEPEEPEEPEEDTSWDCPECGHTHDTKEDGHLVRQDGTQACTECSTVCPNCDEHVDNDDMNEIVGPRRYGASIGRRTRPVTEYVCERCLDNSDNYFRCGDCGNNFNNDHAMGSNTNDETVCESCGENYFSCDDCGGSFHVDHYGEDGRCDECSRQNQKSDLIEDASYKPRPIFHGTGGRHLGVESEVLVGRGGDLGDAAEDTLNKLNVGGLNFAYLKEDGSLDEDGAGNFEIVTHPATLDVHKNQWATFLDRQPRALKTNESCGIHIHVGKEHLSKLDIYKMHTFINAPQNKAFVVGIAGRYSPTYAEFEPKGAGDIMRDLRGSARKYRALNLSPDKTVEFRIFKGTLDKRIFHRSLEFADAVTSFAKHDSTSLQHLHGTEHFINFVLARSKAYPELAEFCKNYSPPQTLKFNPEAMRMANILPAPAQVPEVDHAGKIPMSVKVSYHFTPENKIRQHAGEHKLTHDAVKDLFGHDTDGVPAWQATNNIMSADMPYNLHTKAASRIVAEWLAAGKPTDSGSLNRLIKRSGDFGSKHSGIVQALANIGSVRNNGSATKQHRAHHGGDLHLPFSTLLGATSADVHLSRGLYHPTFDDFEHRSDILSQVKSRLSDLDALGERKAKIASQYPVKSSLVDAISKLPVATKKTPYNLLRKVSTNIERRPKVYTAYKEAIESAAKKLGWTKDEVLESVYTSMLGLMAHKVLGMPEDKVQEYLNNDAIGKGWKSHESANFSKMVDSYSRAQTVTKTLRRMEARTNEIATRNSRSGIVRNSNVPDTGDNASHVPPFGGVGERIKRAVIQKLTSEGLVDEHTGKMKTAQIGEPLQLAHYDEELDFVPALQRAVSANHRMFIEHLKKVLIQAGIHPHNLLPAVHDLGRAARVGVVALGERTNPQANLTSAAWTGLLGRQPGMLSFTAHPQGPDSVYSFSHPDANAVRSTLDGAGVMNRVLVPSGTTYNVYLYDKGRQKRQHVAQALGQLNTTAEEWWGHGTPIGGNKGDMGRDQYRNTINKAEQAQQFSRRIALKLAALTNDHDAFRRAIDAAPQDDAPKLIYADYLQENGNDEDANRWKTMVKHKHSGLPLTPAQSAHAKMFTQNLPQQHRNVRIIHAPEGSYLHGTPTAIFDKHKQIEEFSNRMQQSPLSRLVDKVRETARNRETRQRVGM